ncbi:hypothetical protein JD844_015132 [Phrynosoma platyrhinos]|uniref:Septin-type G domain-containing protein n=1 Tax=Phrynosoma platyrhinos TaxID=52577 RepID=A0ABQ7T7C6_PHRPL|nr:hypothetical protein JD844_015132 [Phrynosoma platyrhinos]
MLIRTHMHDLKDVTCDVHYENYRAQCIQQMTSKLTQDNRIESPIPILPLPTPDAETEKLIKMKDEEVRLWFCLWLLKRLPLFYEQQ